MFEAANVLNVSLLLQLSVSPLVKLAFSLLPTAVGVAAAATHSCICLFAAENQR